MWSPLASLEGVRIKYDTMSSYLVPKSFFSYEKVFCFSDNGNIMTLRIVRVKFTELRGGKDLSIKKLCMQFHASSVQAVVDRTPNYY